MQNLIVTAGESFSDIDVVACAVAYAELLRLENKNAEVVLPGVFNNSVTPTVRSWGFKYSTKPTVKEYKSIVVDVSEPAFIAKCAPMDSIVEIFDHRYGFQDIWNEMLADRAHMDLVGSCGTLIWEEFEKRGFADKISPVSANLLLVSIVSNTLNFKSQNTDPRDIKAAKSLEAHIDMPANWIATYFEEQEREALRDIRQTIISDTKTLKIPSLSYPVVMGQLELWNSKAVFESHLDMVESALASFGEPDWFLSSPCIGEGRNYLFTKSGKVKALLTKHIGAKFTGDIGFTDKLWLRKEIRRVFLESK